MGVDEEYRNNGIGHQILDFIKKYAKENNYTDLKLTVNEENECAIHLYEKVGFRVKNIAYSMQVL
jgi:ribosomal protein S18 acetylase RimI-like enzyme